MSILLSKASRASTSMICHSPATAPERPGPLATHLDGSGGPGRTVVSNGDPRTVKPSISSLVVNAPDTVVRNDTTYTLFVESNATVGSTLDVA